MAENVNIFIPIQKDRGNSFQMQGHLIAMGLNELGYNTMEVDIRKGIGLPNSIADIYLPLWIKDPYQFNNKSIPVGIADTDRFWDKYIKILKTRPYKKLATPSQFVSNVFGDLPRKEVIPHALDPDIYNIEKTMDFDVPSFYLNAPHSWQRKGLDVSIQVLDKLYNEGEKFTAIVRMWKDVPKELRERPYVKIIEGFIFDKKEQYGIMKSCDYLLYPVRGGAFEIPILEALYLGLTPIIPDVQPFNEIPLNRNDVYWGQSNGKGVYYQDTVHTGKMYEMDVDSFLTATREALHKGKKHVNKDDYVKHYNYKDIAKKYLD